MTYKRAVLAIQDAISGAEYPTDPGFNEAADLLDEFLINAGGLFESVDAIDSRADTEDCVTARFLAQVIEEHSDFRAWSRHQKAIAMSALRDAVTGEAI